MAELLVRGELGPDANFTNLIDQMNEATSVEVMESVAISPSGKQSGYFDASNMFALS